LERDRLRKIHCANKDNNDAMQDYMEAASEFEELRRGSAGVAQASWADQFEHHSTISRT
jgi:hypothetical protein